MRLEEAPVQRTGGDPTIAWWSVGDGPPVLWIMGLTMRGVVWRHQVGDLESHGLVDVRYDMTQFDAERLHQLIENQLHYTGSARARQILDAWEDYRPKFVKVMPVEYRKVLAQQHLDSDEAKLASV